jgi:isopenicillin N synthase-like dioxygenase
MLSKKVLKYFITSTKNLPTIDLSQYIHQRGNFKNECEKVADSLRKYGCCIVKDHYFQEEHNNEFMDLMERYFNNRAIKAERNQNLEDFFPEHGYQAGLMKEYLEIPQNYKEIVDKLTEENKPFSVQPPKPDAKWRFFWRVGSALHENSETVKLPKYIPKDFPEFSFVMVTFKK